MTKNSVIEKIKSFYPISKNEEECLSGYVDLLKKWNQKINLIGNSTVDDIWERHILDSAQLLKYIPKEVTSLTDFGSGAGLPGIVLAILGIPEVHLIESNGKKAIFLEEAARITGTKIYIHNERAEEIQNWGSDIITARAFAEMDKLLSYIYPFIKKDSLCLLIKGCRVTRELERAQENWLFEYQLYPSVISDNNVTGYLVKLSGLKSKNEQKCKL